jgi:hypothetical protein
MDYLPQQATELALSKAATMAEKGGVVLATGSGAGLWLGWTSAQWSVAGIIGGLVIGLIGVLLKTGVDIYFRAQHLKLTRAAMRIGEGD